MGKPFRQIMLEDEANNQKIVREPRFLFRAWDGEQMHYWNSVDHPATAEISGTPTPKLFYLPMSYLVGDCNDWTWMQFIGLKDKEGTELYEGDVVEVEGGVGVIVWDGHDLSWDLSGTDMPLSRSSTLKVIGNVHEHPDLIPR